MKLNNIKKNIIILSGYILIIPLSFILSMVVGVWCFIALIRDYWLYGVTDNNYIPIKLEFPRR